MPNTANINKVIEALEKDREVGTHFTMGTFYSYLNEDKVPDEERGTYQECNTALCIAGWANFLKMREEYPSFLKDMSEFSYRIDSTSHAAEWLGILEEDGLNLFYMRSSSGCSLDLLSSFDDDRFASIEQRYNAGIRVLEILRDEGIVDWERALKEVGIPHANGSEFYNYRYRL